MLQTLNHVEAVASTTWTITHNFGENIVAVDSIVLNGGDLEKVNPASITHTSDNVLTITFSVAQEGRARLIAGL